jgi:hypothetical protein
MLKKSFSFLLLFFNVCVFADSISFNASIDKKQVALNDSFVYSVTISGDSNKLPQHELPQLTDFNRYGTSTSQRMSITNGKSNVSITYSYTLGPKKIGKFIIPPSSIVYDGKTYSTESMNIEVIQAQGVQNIHSTNAGSSADNYQQAKRRQGRNVNTEGKAFVKASINKKTIYENEKLVYKFKFYTNIDLISNPEYYPPDFSGFWNDGSKPNNSFETVDGINYQVNEIETVLYPIGVGTKKIAPAKLKIAVMDFSRSSSDDFFGFFASMGRGENKVLAADEITVNVIPLPSEGKPVNFSGAIGNFKIKSEIDKNIVSTNEPVTLKVSISGNGNMKSVNDIKIDLGNGFKKYDTIVANSTENLKEFQTIIVPTAPGEKEIPSASLSFFNLQTKKYETIKTEPKKITVNGEAIYNIENSENGNAKTGIVRQDINYNKDIKKLNQFNGYFIQKSIYYFIVIPFILMAILIFIYKKFIKNILFDKITSSKKYSYDKIYRHLERAKLEISKSNFSAAVSFMSAALAGFINIKIKNDSEKLQKNQIRKTLRDNNVSDNDIAEIEKLFDIFNFYKFASVDIDKNIANSLLENISKILNNN